MASFNKFNLSVQDFLTGNCILGTDTVKVMLTNTLPVPTNHQYSDVSGAELASGSGYTTGGATVTGTTVTNASGTSSLGAAATTWTSVTGAMGPFR